MQSRARRSPAQEWAPAGSGCWLSIPLGKAPHERFAGFERQQQHDAQSDSQGHVTPRDRTEFQQCLCPRQEQDQGCHARDGDADIGQRTSANIEASEHFDREAQALNLGGTNNANLEDAMAGEHYENVTMYVNFAKQAEAAGDVKVAAMFRQIAVDEGTHYDAYKAALAKLPAR